MNNGFNLFGRRGLSFLVVILPFLSVYGACKGYMYVRAYVRKYYFIVCGVVCVCVDMFGRKNKGKDKDSGRDRGKGGGSGGNMAAMLGLGGLDEFDVDDDALEAELLELEGKPRGRCPLCEVQVSVQESLDLKLLSAEQGTAL